MRIFKKENSAKENEELLREMSRQKEQERIDELKEKGFDKIITVDDLVTHRCRTCYMVVIRVEGDKISCEWMDKNFHMQEGIFRKSSLIKVDEEGFTRL